MSRSALLQRCLRFRQPAELPQGVAAVAVSFGVVRLELQGAVVAGQRLAVLLLPGQGDAQVVMRLRRPRPAAQHLAVDGRRLGQPGLPGERHAQVVVGFAVLRLPAQRLAEAVGCLAMPAQVEQGDPQVIAGIRRLRLQCQGRLVGGNRLFQPAEPAQGVASVLVCLYIVRAAPHRFVEACQRFRLLALLGQGDAQVVVRLGAAWLQADRITHARLRLLPAFVPGEEEAALFQGVGGDGFGG